ncbi:hypothetical protein [Pinisolibacter aquiterrae]|jgi:hypothetical protein|uniref:hypothetical protein n=1 Tax=Pinisolibacter aquiterrae TaxID=2815579 RepID=UPI001C3D193C|nr:hypothetical protein [Pinisolibacter aquiterrae]MBV5262945.1 hypothetical protein [Pinisolibacter aquiterrae]MCC8235286.1 hypothetical protein [Pinisolibacter aquiterrae]
MALMPISSGLAALQSTGTVFSDGSPKASAKRAAETAAMRTQGYGSLARVQTMAANQAKKNGMGENPAGLLDAGMYSFSVMSGVGAAAAMMFSDTWTAGTKTSGTMLDYYA